MSDTKTCKFCGEEILVVAVKCKHCGSNLPSFFSSLELEVTKVITKVTYFLIFLIFAGLLVTNPGEDEFNSYIINRMESKGLLAKENTGVMDWLKKEVTSGAIAAMTSCKNYYLFHVCDLDTSVIRALGKNVPDQRFIGVGGCWGRGGERLYDQDKCWIARIGGFYERNIWPFSDKKLSSAPPIGTPQKPFDCADCPEMVVIPAGSFEMGGTDSGAQPVHRVTLRSFSLGKTEVTQGQWRAVMGSNPSSFSNCGDNCPVEQVSWEDAKQFVNRLSAKTGKTYRLPSEAEWEYACRAGGRHEYCGSSRVDDVGWHDGNSGRRTNSVGGKQANAWGLHDMSGNVWEWTEDCWNENYNGAPTDGRAWTAGDCSLRVVRGGSWFDLPQLLRAASRGGGSSAGRGNLVGFRVARTD